MSRFNFAKTLRLLAMIAFCLSLWTWIFNGMPVPSKNWVLQLPRQVFSWVLGDKNQILFPKIRDDWRTGKYVPNQWQFKDYYFALIVNDKTEVKREPSFDSDTVAKLQRLERIRLIYCAAKSATTNAQRGRWVFATTEDGVRTLGWILESDIATIDKFKAIEDWQGVKKLSFVKGDFFAILALNGDGSFSSEWRSSGQGIHLRGNSKGQIYRYRNLIWFKKENADEWFDFFFLDEQNKLQQEWKYRKSGLEVLR